MLTFIGIFATGVAALLGAQHYDIECTAPRPPAKPARAETSKHPGFEGAVAHS